MQLRRHIGVARPHSNARLVGQAHPAFNRTARPVIIALIIAIVFGNAFFSFPFFSYANNTLPAPRLHNGQPCLKPDGTPCEQHMYFFLHDQLGGITATVDEDGNVVERNDYFPYGTERMNVKSPGAPTNNYLFTQGEYDENLGLYYFNKRWYDPKIGRFMSPDPLLLNPQISDAELQKLLHNPQSLNMYSYAGNNPINYIDPTGEKVELVARRVLGILGHLATHAFLQISPDNPSDFQNVNFFTLGGYWENGNLVKNINHPNEFKNPKENQRSINEISPPSGKTDTEFINQIMDVYSRYDKNREYALTGIGGNKNKSNCNNFTTGLLEGAGVKPEVIDNIDPSGANWGLGTPLPEMLDAGKTNRAQWQKEFTQKAVAPQYIKQLLQNGYNAIMDGLKSLFFGSKKSDNKK